MLNIEDVGAESVKISDIPALLSELKSLRAENARLREALATAASDLDETAIAVQQLMTDGRPSHAAATIRACADRAASILGERG